MNKRLCITSRYTKIVEATMLETTCMVKKEALKTKNNSKERYTEVRSYLDFLTAFTYSYSYLASFSVCCFKAY